MANKTTELVFIIDKSGSMAGLVTDTIGGFNSMIESQKKIEGDVFVSTVLFNDKTEVIYDRVSIQKVEPMTGQQYQVYGNTALIDAIGLAIHHIGNVHKYARKEDVPEKTLFVITTDGYENASYIYRSEEVKEMIKRQEEKYGWEFLFVAANIDAVETAERFGIRRNRAANYDYTEDGTDRLYRAMNRVVKDIRCCSQISEDWADELHEEDND